VIVSELAAVIAIRSEGFAACQICVPLIGFSSMPAFASLTLRLLRITSEIWVSAGTMAQRVHNEAFNGGELRVATPLRRFPVALLTREDKGS
jgi:hypothetical protein